MQNTITPMVNLGKFQCLPNERKQSISTGGSGNDHLLDDFLPANNLAIRFKELLQLAKVVNHNFRSQPISQYTITPIGNDNLECKQPTFTDSKSEFDFPRLEQGWKRSSARGAVYKTDDQNVVRAHSWGPKNEDNFDESVFPDGYSVRRDREGSFFESFPGNDGQRYFRLRKTDGQEYCWKGTLRPRGDVGLTLVETIPDEDLYTYRGRAEDVGLHFDASSCVRLNWSQGSWNSQ
jgi:hypothetical protein